MLEFFIGFLLGGVVGVFTLALMNAVPDYEDSYMNKESGDIDNEHEPD